MPDDVAKAALQCPEDHEAWFDASDENSPCHPVSLHLRDIAAESRTWHSGSDDTVLGALLMLEVSCEVVVMMA